MTKPKEILKQIKIAGELKAKKWVVRHRHVYKGGFKDGATWFEKHVKDQINKDWQVERERLLRDIGGG